MQMRKVVQLRIGGIRCVQSNLRKNGFYYINDSYLLCYFLFQSDIKFQIEQPGYNSSYALRFEFEEYVQTHNWWYGITRDIPEDCLGAGDAFSISFNVKLFDKNGSPISCDPSSQVNEVDSCPLVRMAFRNEGESARWFDFQGIREWNQGEWNNYFLESFIEAEYDNLDLIRFQIVLGGNSDTAERVVVIDDVKVHNDLTIVASDAPSSSRAPSQSPTNFPDYTAETIFKVLDEKGEDIYLKNVISTVEVRILCALFLYAFFVFALTSAFYL